MALWQRFIDLHQQQRLPHAILLTGATLAEQEALAQKMAQHLLAVDSKNAQLFASQDGHPDLLKIVPEGKAELIKIDQVRLIGEFLSKTALQGGYRVIILSPADRLNMAAANALLKSLEEPGANTVLLLLSVWPHLLLPTIRSRCQGWSLGAAVAQTPEELELQKAFVTDLLTVQDPLVVAERYQQQPLLQVIDWLIRLSHAIIAEQLHLDLPQPHLAKQHAAMPKRALTEWFGYVEYCYQAKALLNRQINVNPQLFLENLLIEWFTVVSH